jgi:hypothetical protein
MRCRERWVETHPTHEGPGALETAATGRWVDAYPTLGRRGVASGAARRRAAHPPKGAAAAARDTNDSEAQELRWPFS